MEYIEILNRIIEAEKRAQQIEGNAREKEAHLNEDITSELNAIHEKYQLRVQNRMMVVKKQEEQYTAEQLSSLEELYQQDLYSLEKNFSDHSHEWLDRLFNIIIGADKP